MSSRNGARGANAVAGGPAHATGRASITPLASAAATRSPPAHSDANTSVSNDVSTASAGARIAYDVARDSSARLRSSTSRKINGWARSVFFFASAAVVVVDVVVGAVAVVVERRRVHPVVRAVDEPPDPSGVLLPARARGVPPLRRGER